MRESQQFAWQSLPVQVEPVLAGTVPVLQWLENERI
jgi:8-oxo-dGTP diphosphatase